MKLFFVITLLLNLIVSGRADFSIATGGKADCVIVRQEGATAPELKATEELVEIMCPQ